MDVQYMCGHRGIVAESGAGTNGEASIASLLAGGLAAHGGGRSGHREDGDPDSERGRRRLPEVPARRRLFEALSGALARAAALFAAAQQAFTKGEIRVLDLENTRHAYADTKDNYIDAIFGHEENWLRLEWAAGRDITL